MKPFYIPQTRGPTMAEVVLIHGAPYCFGHFRPNCTWCAGPCVSAGVCRRIQKKNQLTTKG